jgi:AcrR family transcriptional regulator
MSEPTTLKSAVPQKTENSAGSRLETRRRAFLDAANAAFLDKGYANTTLGDIIARSGGSRQTLYALFGGKQGLFEAIISERSAEFLRPLRAQGQYERTPEAILVEIGTHFLQAVLAPAAIGLFRLVVAEGPFMPELSERCWALGPANTVAEFERYFGEHTRGGVLKLRDPNLAAHQFLGLLLGTFHMQCLLGVRETPSGQEIETSVKAAVKLFLDGSGYISG